MIFVKFKPYCILDAM